MRRERGTQVRKQWPVQVVDHHDGVEMFAGERPVPCFEIASPRLDARTTGQRAQRRGVAIDRDHARASLGEESGVAAVARGKVEDARTGHDEVRKARDPR